MDIRTHGHTITEAEEETLKHRLRHDGFRLSGPIVIDGVNVGFIAVRFDEEMNVQEAAIVVVTDA